MFAPRLLLACTLLLGTLTPALALDTVVTPSEVKIPNFAFASGETIPELRLGYETYGQPNATRDNAILICHFFAGDKHAAGRYAGETRRGWWDALIGPGLPIDTNRYWVISTDIPSGMMVKRDHVVTTGPSSIDPRTGEPYGMRFPAVRVRDLVEAQKAVIDRLGVRHLRAVTGPSLGGMVAWQWAIQYPTYVDQAIPVAGPVTFETAERYGFESSRWAIQSDPWWAMGDYWRTGIEPDTGVAMALYGLGAIQSGQGFLLPWFWSSYLNDAKRYDANHYLRTLELHSAYELGQEYGSRDAALRRVRAKVTAIGFRDDDFVTLEELRSAVAECGRAGVNASLVELRGTEGHLSVLENLDELAAPFRAALR